MAEPVVVPDAVADLAGYVLAACDVREARIKAATPGPWQTSGHDAEEDGCGLLGGGVPGSIDERGIAFTTAFTNVRCHADAVHIAAEANPAHALAEVALWRVVVADHQRRQGNAAAALGEDIGTWRDVSPSFIAVVAAARAYLTGTGG